MFCEHCVVGHYRVSHWSVLCRLFFHNGPDIIWGHANGATLKGGHSVSNLTNKKEEVCNGSQAWWSRKYIQTLLGEPLHWSVPCWPLFCKSLVVSLGGSYVAQIQTYLGTFFSLKFDHFPKRWGKGK